jgi:glycosyltransferase involved in cell wall biosynthesis
MMSSSFDRVKVTMIDALVGNDYSVCLCSALHAAGVDVELITPDNRLVSMPVDFPIRPWMPAKDPRGGKIGKTIHYLKYLAQLLVYVVKQDKGRRVVHFQFFRRERIESLLFPLLRLLGVNLVFTAHNVLPHENSRIDYLLRFMVYRSAKVIIVHSEYMKSKLAKGFRVDQEKVKVIPHGNFDHYIPKEPISKAEARASLQLSEIDSVALFFGYIREYKGLDLLLNAFEICARKGTPLKLVIAGAAHPPELENYYRRRTDQISRNGSILFHAGFIPSEKVAAYFIACDVVILPYREIDHSGIVHLAYSFGRPLITTNVGDFPEIIEDGRSGYLLRENSAECLSETMLGAFSSKPSLEDMGSYARKLGETRYSWIDVANQMRDLYATQA